MNGPQRLSGVATRYLRLLADYGHAEDGVIDRIVLDAAEMTDDEIIPLDVIRRLAAEDLFKEHPPEKLSPISEDWPLLFS